MEGDTVEILKLATQTGNRALVKKANWNGMLKVEMLTGDQVEGQFAKCFSCERKNDQTDQTEGL